MAGNSLKAGVRFFSYDKFKKMLVDRDVSVVIVLGSSPFVLLEAVLFADTLSAPTPTSTISLIFHVDQSCPRSPPLGPHSPISVASFARSFCTSPPSPPSLDPLPPHRTALTLIINLPLSHIRASSPAPVLSSPVSAQACARLCSL